MEIFTPFDYLFSLSKTLYGITSWKKLLKKYYHVGEIFVYLPKWLKDIE